MNYLLDTHTFIWFIEDDASLSPTAKALIEDGNNVIYLSLASIWEMAIKVNLGKLRFNKPFDEFIKMQLQLNNIKLLEIELEHTLYLADLPLHHRDPFDRLIITQALLNNLPLLGVDTAFDSYSIVRIW